MDKLIIVIALYYFFKYLFRFLKADQEKRKGTTGHPPFGHYQPSHRPPASPVLKGGRTTPHTPDFQKNLSEIGEILKDLKWEAEIPMQTSIPREASRRAFPQAATGDRKREVQKGPLAAPREKPSTVDAGKKVHGGDIRPIPEERTTGFSIRFDQPESFLHGIILSEILRQPISMRVPPVPPYMR